MRRLHRKRKNHERRNRFEEIRVGEKVKALREQKGLSLKELADLTGFSTALLSQMENHLVSPSLGTMIKLAKALGVRVGDFLGETEGEPFAIVRKDERKTVSRFASKEGVKYGYSYESLGFEKKNRHMEPFIVTLEPATVKTSKTSVHDGEEFIFVLEGEMEVILETIPMSFTRGIPYIMILTFLIASNVTKIRSQKFWLCSTQPVLEGRKVEEP